MIHQMTWSHCGLDYHVHIAPDPQARGGCVLRISDEAFAQDPLCLRLPSVADALDHAVIYVFPDISRQEQDHLLATLVAEDAAVIPMVA